jgi:hypothetical protein
LDISSCILAELDGGRSVFLVLLDLSAAFDTINHELLLSRLRDDFNIAGVALDWFRSYLSGRKFCVQAGGFKSKDYPLDIGVPQGSVLGPLLFTLFTTPLMKIFAKHEISYHLYADDTQFWVSFDHKNPDSELAARTALSCVFQEVEKWMANHSLKLNPSKTVFLPISRHKKYTEFLPLALNSLCSIPASQQARNLGVWFDSEFSFKHQIDEVRRVSFFHLRRLRNIRDFVPMDCFQSLMHAFVTSRLDYCNSLYFSLPCDSIRKLDHLLSAAAKVVLCRSKFSSSTEAFKELHWLPVQARVKYKVALLTFKAVHGCGPEYFKRSLSFKPVLHSPRAPYRNLIHSRFLPRPRLKSCGDRVFYHSAVGVWNSLPPALREIDKISMFTKQLKTWLFQTTLS